MRTGPCSGTVIVATAGCHASAVMGSASTPRPPRVFLPARNTQRSAPDLRIGMGAVSLTREDCALNLNRGDQAGAASRIAVVEPNHNGCAVGVRASVTHLTNCGEVDRRAPSKP